ncbi:radical SAM family heme chaperone HemW [Butyrivibrio sp. WCD3002]|uniref:radical SAM family heme chaperone HemW n=1 Tax=Butyrivibrio sp. WCD3002 TaxID=1280676 RepID=UPI001FA7431C|nr:radical SAM family heme chaperone HemW [Butyrivibrio sp. WCD3002]
MKEIDGRGFRMESLGIYIHIPFCIRKCLYCDFLSFPKGRAQQALYFDALEKEILLSATGCGKYEVQSVFFGGGTPTAVMPEAIVRIMKALFDNFSFKDDAEITIECNPGTADLDALKAYRNAGINRLSIGLQSAKDDELKRLGRIHDREMFEECYRNAIKAGFENINVDLMSALPGQTLTDWEDNLKYVCTLDPAPCHISAYSLIIEEGTPFYELYGEDNENKDIAVSVNMQDGSEYCQNPRLPLPDEDTERQMYHRTEEILSSYGYRRYEISNYSAKGKECIHNLRYWQGGDYLGLGLGASSLMKNERYHNTSDFERYIETLNGDFSIGEAEGKDGAISLSAENQRLLDIREDVEPLDEKARMEEFMFLGLRLTAGVSANEFRSRFGKEIGEIYGGVIEGLREKNLLEWDGDTIRLSAEGLDVSNYCMAEFLL